MILSNKNKKETFITSGFSNCRLTETKDLIQTIRSTLKLQQDRNRKTLIKIMSIIRYLARQGIALRGHNEENSNFIQLLNLRAEDDVNLKEWLLRKSKKYTSPIIQNEILKDMALTILRVFFFL